MARPTKYYHPVKDLISSDSRNSLIDIWNKENFSSLIVNASESKQTTLNIHGYSQPYETYIVRTNPLIYHPINDICEEIMDMYEADSWNFIYSEDDTKKFPPHIDPTFHRSCCITFPLFPNYSEFRPTNFYESEDEESYIMQVDYAKLRKPVLLNLRKYHGLIWEKPTESLTFQVGFKKDYNTVLKTLQQRNLLSTPF